MIKLHEIEQLKLPTLQASMVRALLTDIHYYLDQGMTEEQAISVLKTLLGKMEQ
ncbi:MAG: hypothetical protein LUQ65_02815 [Candidatus Helarchaeota archaeon]|nr:hypothetical protein [Candidatus Helarchaeota archaeon]